MVDLSATHAERKERLVFFCQLIEIMHWFYSPYFCSVHQSF